MEPIKISSYRRTCENCTFWNPPQYRDGILVRDSSCGHPGGWTPVFYGRGPYREMKCKEFRRKQN